MFRSRSLAALLAFSLLVTAIPAAYAQVTYSVRRVDPTDRNVAVSDLNNLGEMVGESGFQSPPIKALLWRNGQRITLGSVLANGGSHARASTIDPRSPALAAI
jgi:hypothetical protein